MENTFDTKREIEISVLHPEGRKACRVRWPTDEEWIEHSARRRVVVSQLSRDESVTEVMDGERAAGELLGKIRIDKDGLALDEYEASYVIERLSRAQVEDCARADGGMEIVLKVPGASTKHALRVPSLAEVVSYRRSFSRLVENRRGKQILKINLRAAGDFYDKLAQSKDGYAGDVPVIHKAAVITEMLGFLEAEQESDAGEA
jgi:hypothetical protein